MVAAKSPSLHILNAVELDDLVGSFGGGFGLSGGIHLGDRGEEHGSETVLLEVLLELLLRELGGCPVELGRGVAVGEVDSWRLGEGGGLGSEGYLLLLWSLSVKGTCVFGVSQW